MIELPAKEEGVAVPINRVKGVEDAERNYAIPFSRGSIRRVVTFRDKLYAVPEVFFSEQTSLYLFLDNNIALSISGIISRIEQNSVKIEDNCIVYGGRKFKIIDPERIVSEQED